MTEEAKDSAGTQTLVSSHPASWQPWERRSQREPLGGVGGAGCGNPEEGCSLHLEKLDNRRLCLVQSWVHQHSVTTSQHFTGARNVSPPPWFRVAPQASSRPRPLISWAPPKWLICGRRGRSQLLKGEQQVLPRSPIMLSGAHFKRGTCQPSRPLA